ncbi:MAG TPA: family 43 glycosylhydrolase, partial [Verrucomicrobiae bacterium]
MKNPGWVNWRFIWMMIWCCGLGIAGPNAWGWQADNGDGTFKNPVLYADYPDPDIIRVSNDFYLVSTTFADSPGINVLHSKDLVNWELSSHVATNLDGGNFYNLIGGSAYRGGFWASSLRYYNGTFYVLANPTFANSRIYYATNAAGPWQYHQLSQSTYDPGLFIETNGTGYIVYGYSPYQSVATLNADFSAILSVSNNVLLSGGEGTHIVKQGAYYYAFNANPGIWPYQLRCSRATNIFGPWETNHVVLTETTGGHQGAIVDLDDSGTNFYGFVHQDSGAVGRMTRIGPVFWSGNWPVFGTTSASNQMSAGYAKPVLGQAIMQPATTDEFTNASLGLQWQWNHNPDNTKWSLSARPGWLRLQPTIATNFWLARNTLTQKGQGPWSRGEIKMDISQLQAGDTCGFGTLGTTNGQIAIYCDANGGKYLTMNVIAPTNTSGTAW